MVAVTIKVAKAKLNELVHRAVRGEDVILMKGSRHVASIVPITEEDLELAPRLSDEQALRVLDQIRRERAEGRMRRFASPEQAVASLRRELASHPTRRRRK